MQTGFFAAETVPRRRGERERERGEGRRRRERGERERRERKITITISWNISFDLLSPSCDEVRVRVRADGTVVVD